MRLFKLPYAVPDYPNATPYTILYPTLRCALYCAIPTYTLYNAIPYYPIQTTDCNGAVPLHVSRVGSGYALKLPAQVLPPGGIQEPVVTNPLLIQNF